jgi:hypothetical protein
MSSAFDMLAASQRIMTNGLQTRSMECMMEFSLRSSLTPHLLLIIDHLHHGLSNSFECVAVDDVHVVFVGMVVRTELVTA